MNETGTPEHEPDYRFTLANERTFLAWIRTSLALLAAAVALGHLVADFGPDVLRRGVAVGLAGLAVLTAVTSLQRWKRVQDAVDRGEPLPRSATVWVLAAALLAVGVVVAVLVVTSGPPA